MTALRWTVPAGVLLWLAGVVVIRPSPLEREWGFLLLSFAPLVLVPLGLRLVGKLLLPGRVAEWASFPAAALLLVSFLYPAGNETALWSLPWLFVTVLVAMEGVLRIFRRGLTPLPDLCVDLGLIFLVVGGAWTTASRAGIHPMGFDDTIVLLTANHFHYAGFVVPLVAGFAAREQPGRFGRLTILGVLAGVPLVAVGITATKLGYSPWLECFAALVMAASGLCVAFLHLSLSARRGPTPVRLCWAFAGASLFAGMLLAALYGVRFSTKSDEVLTIPWMRFIHGSINAFGFATMSLVGWWLNERGNGVKDASRI